MRAYVVRRVLGSLFVMLAALSLVFVMTRVAPGKPAETILGAAATPESVAELNHQLGLDESLGAQYVDYMWNAVHGDFGDSYYSHESAMATVIDRIPVTAELAFLTMLASVVVALGLTIVTARARSRWLNGVADGASLIGLSIPTFWSGLLLLLLFGLYWPDIIPAGGWVYFSDDPIENLKTCILPVFALSLPTFAILYRSLRSSMQDVVHRDYVTYGRAAGLREGKVIRKVAVPNAIVPTATVAGLLLGYLLGGSLIIETIMSIPGLGQLVVYSLQRRDYPVATASIAVIAVSFVLVNLAVDLVYATLSPRVRDLYSRKVTIREA
jgi:peptide/nickel transport system permease protein